MVTSKEIKLREYPWLFFPMSPQLHWAKRNCTALYCNSFCTTRTLKHCKESEQLGIVRWQEGSQYFLADLLQCKVPWKKQSCQEKPSQTTPKIEQNKSTCKADSPSSLNQSKLISATWIKFLWSVWWHYIIQIIYIETQRIIQDGKIDIWKIFDLIKPSSFLRTRRPVTVNFCIDGNSFRVVPVGIRAEWTGVLPKRLHWLG